jgi:broad specificity phosphatase PhoE
LKTEKLITPNENRQVFLVRHGICEPNGVLLGQFDAPLSAAGEEQVEVLARQLESRGIERVLSSSLRRALRTAEVIAKRLGVEVATDARLNEISYGTWDGLRWEEIERADPETARRKLEDWWSVTPLGGEPVTAFYRRVEQAWHSLADHAAGVTAVVAHRGVNAILLDLAGHPDNGPGGIAENRWRRIATFEQEYCAYELATLPARSSRNRSGAVESIV